MSSDAREASSSPAVTPSEEQVATLADGVEICFQTFGDPTGDPLLLVMGLGGPLTWWPDALCEQLAAAGFFVVRYDNRDTGHSTLFRDGRVTRQHLVNAFLGRRVPVPYSLRDMAQDGVALLDHLGVRAAHVAGVSMGGMIAQTMALESPDRVLSLTSLSSTTGNRRVGFQDPRLLPHLLRRAGRTREEYVAGLGVLLAADLLAGLPRPRRVGARAGRGDLRPRHQPQRGDAAHDRGPHPARPDRGAAARCGSRPPSSTGWPTAWSTSPAGAPRPRPSPTPTWCSCPAWATTCRTGLHGLFVETIRRTADRAR